MFKSEFDRKYENKYNIGDIRPKPICLHPYMHGALALFPLTPWFLLQIVGRWLLRVGCVHMARRSVAQQPLRRSTRCPMVPLPSLPPFAISSVVLSCRSRIHGCSRSHGCRATVMAAATNRGAPPAYVALLPLLYMELHHRMCSPSSTQCPLVAISRDGLAFYVYLDRVQPNLIYLLHP